MTQPPQPPGPGGWGPQQPGQHPQGQPQQGQPGGWQGQPGGQYPQSGPQPGGWQGQPGGQYPGGQQQPPHPPGFDGQPKKKSPLPWILGGIGAIVVVAGAIIAVLLSTGGPGDPRDTAQQYAETMNQQDFASLAPLHCQQEQGMAEEFANPAKAFEDEGMPPEQAEELANSMEFNLTLDDVREEGDEKAAAKFSGDMAVSFAGQEQKMPVNQERPMIVEDGEWRFCGGVDVQMGD